MKISLLIPLLNERAALERLRPRLEQMQGLEEILLADGGSRDGSPELAERAGWRVIQSPKGRGLQLEAARREARGEILWMLHADTRPPQRAPELLRRAFSRPEVEASAFRLAYEKGGWAMALVAWGGNWRSRLRRRPYGDQALAVRASTLEQLGGFPPWPYLEDLWLVDRLRREGRRLHLLREPVYTDPRRYREKGIWNTLLAHQRIVGHFDRHGSPPAWSR